MSVSIAIITGALSLANYYWNVRADLSQSAQTASITAQVILSLITIITLFLYRGRHISRYQTVIQKKFVFTLRFGLIVLSAVGNLAVLAWFFLPQFHP